MSASPIGSVVTGDAVVLDVQIAQLPVRAVAAVIDVMVVLMGLYLGTMLWGMTLFRMDTALSAAILTIYTVLVIVGYPVIFETASRGRTLGMMAMGLRVVSDDGSPERFRQALFRALASIVEIWALFGSPAVISSLLSEKGKRIGDIFAGTIVISERGPKLAPPPQMPPALAGWAAGLQLSGLSPEQAELARQFLSRAPGLEPAVRDEMAIRIGNEVAQRISPAPPPGVPPQYMLAAVLAERHRREVLRLQAAAARAQSAAPGYPPPSGGFAPSVPAWGAAAGPPSGWGSPSGWGAPPGSPSAGLPSAVRPPAGPPPAAGGFATPD
ncbi:hypothetical protein MBRU_13220 [Mycolicibacterium brumae DSM 44177]|nr:hypothetical protein MBRU_13220 [Mycolicibacterium brumae DSM 44177]